MFAIVENARRKLAESSTARRLITGAGWAGIATLASSGFNLLVTACMARLLGKEQFGYLIAIQTTLGLIGVLAGFGLGTTATRYIAELKNVDREKLSRILRLTERAVLTFGLLASVLTFFLSSYLADRVWNMPSLAFPLALSTVTVFAAALDSYQKSVLIGFEAMRQMAVGNIIAGSVGLPLALGLATIFDLTGAAAGLVSIAVLQGLISRIQMLRCLSLNSVTRSKEHPMSEWRVLRDFALPAFVAGMLVVPANWVCQTLLSRTPNGFAELAILGVVLQWFNTVTFLPTVAAKAILPVLTEKITAGHGKASSQILKVSVLANVAIAVPVALVISIASPWIMGAYGAGFVNNWPVLAAAVCLGILVVGAMPVGIILAAGNRMWIGAVMNFAWALVYIGSATQLVKYGAFGVVASLGLAYLAHAVWSCIIAMHHISKSAGTSVPALS